MVERNKVQRKIVLYKSLRKLDENLQILFAFVNTNFGKSSKENFEDLKSATNF